MTRTGVIGWLLLALGLAPAVAHAIDTNRPIQVQADRIEVDQKTMTSRYRGHVAVEQNGSRIEAAEATVVHRDRGIERIHATGSPLRFFHADRSGRELRAEGRTLEYDAAQDRVRLSGAARVERDGETLEGERIEYFPGSERIEAGDGSARVRMTLIPRASSDQPGSAP